MNAVSADDHARGELAGGRLQDQMPVAPAHADDIDVGSHTGAPGKQLIERHAAHPPTGPPITELTSSATGDGYAVRDPAQGWKASKRDPDAFEHLDARRHQTLAARLVARKPRSVEQLGAHPGPLEHDRQR